ncbi:MAG TPA: hypothetical protein DD391_06540 [Clostridiales bacterium]|nr:gfo/Idh/MocA family oxidoreductase [Clostridiales bacterium]HBL82243.1 hypothetical protein [Clostridiales bacterium]
MMKVAMIGCGGIGEYHLSHLTTFGDIAQLASFCDLILERAEKFAQETGGGAMAYTDFRVMLDEVKPDAVFVCVPPYCHGEIEEELINRNIDFFVEKPLTLDMELAKSIEKRVAEKGLVTAVGFQCRYDMLAEHIKEFVRQNPIPFVDCTRFGSIPEVFWWKDKKLSGGQLVEQTIHQLDYIRYVLGEPETVFSMAARGFVEAVDGYDTDDLSATVVRFENGALATIGTGCYAESGDAFDSKTVFSAKDKRGEMKLLDTFEIFGGQQQEENEIGNLVVKGDGGLSSASKNGLVYQNEGDPGFLCDRTFLEAVLSRDQSKIRSTYSDALKTLAFGLACNKSMETALPVHVQDLLK